MALNYDQYNSLMSFLEWIEKDPNSEVVAESVEKTLENILEAVSKDLSPTAKYTLAKEEFALEKTVTVKANKTQILSLLNTVADEVKKHKELNGMLDFADLFGTTESESRMLDEMIRDIRQDIKSDYESKDMVLSYTVTGGRLTRISLLDQSTDRDKIKYETLVVFTVPSQKEPSEFTVTQSDKITLEGVTTTLENKYRYQRVETTEKTTLTLTVENHSILGNDKTSQAYSTKETHTLNYDKQAKTFSYRHKIPELETESKIEGVWEWDSTNGLCRFGVLKWVEGDTKILEATSAILSVRALGAETLPAGEELFSMSSETWMTIYRQLPFKKLEAIYTDITNRNAGFDYTNQGEPVMASVQRLADRYAEALKNYWENNKLAQKLPTDSVRFYSEDHGLHVLLYYRSSGSVSIAYTNALTTSQRTNYHEATLKNGVLHIHEIEKTSRQEPTCTQDGKQYYKCTDCEKEYYITLSALGHQYTKVRMPVVTDDMISKIAVYEKCQRCGLIDNIMISKDGTINTTNTNAYLVKNSTGYTVVDFYDYNYNGIFCIPDVLSEQLPITALKLEEGFFFYKRIRIPSGVKKLGSNSFIEPNPQVLILPASLTEISNGVFKDTSNLHTIYYAGTEADWNKINLNRYRDEWKGVNVIFCPDGVSPEMASNVPFFSAENQSDALSNAHKQTESADAAITFAQNDGVHLIESGIIKDVLYDRIENTVTVIGAYVDGKQIISIYRAEDFALINQITIDFEIGLADAWDGLVALFDPNEGKILVYRQSDGGFAYSFSPFENSATLVTDLRLIDGFLYYSSNYNVHIYNLSEQTSQEFLSIVSPVIVINRTKHRMAIYSTVDDHCILFFVNTEASQVIKTFTPPKYENFDPIVPWYDDFPYISEGSLKNDKHFDLDGNTLTSKPDIKTVEIILTRQERLCSAVIQTDRLNVSVLYDTSKTVYLQVKTADGEQQKVDYYAENAILLSNGTLLLYTQDGYGLVAVTL